MSSWSSVIFLVILATCFQVSFESAKKRQQEKEILDKIIGEGHYDSRIRPSGTANLTAEDGSEVTDGPCIVDVNLMIRSISKIDDVAMEYAIQITFRENWRDDRLKYDNLGYIKYLVLTDPDKVWKPDMFFSNEKTGNFHDIIMPNVLMRISPDGAVLYSIRISLLLACSMDLKYYPLDHQTCLIKMGSYGYTTEDLVFQWTTLKDPVQVAGSARKLPRFELSNKKTNGCTSRTNTGEYSCIQVHLTFRREFSYYLIQIYIPCIMLVIVSWVSFWLDPNAIPARVSLGVTTLLTMATQISGINASLPPVSYTKAIDVWTGVCLTFVFGALLEFALVNYASRSDGHRAAILKKQAEKQASQEAKQITESNHNQSGFGWDLEHGFDIDSPPSYAMKPVLRGGRFPPLIPTGNSLLGPNARSNPSPAVGVASATMGPSGPFTQKLTKWGDAVPSNQNVIQRWLNSIPSRSKRIDVISRIFFPVMFSMFNVVYWTTYTLRDGLEDIGDPLPPMT